MQPVQQLLPDARPPCPKCGERDPAKFGYLDRDHTRPRNICSACHNAYCVANRARRKAQAQPFADTGPVLQQTGPQGSGQHRTTGVRGRAMDHKAALAVRPMDLVVHKHALYRALKTYLKPATEEIIFHLSNDELVPYTECQLPSGNTLQAVA